MENIAGSMRKAVIGVIDKRNEKIKKVEEMIGKKKTELWEKLNKNFLMEDVNKAIEEIVSISKKESKKGKEAIYYMLYKWRTEKYIVEESKKILNEAIDEKARILCVCIENGQYSSTDVFDGWFDPILYNEDLKHNIFAEKLIEVLSGHGFCAYKKQEEKTETERDDMVSWYTTFYSFGVRVGW